MDESKKIKYLFIIATVIIVVVGVIRSGGGT